MSASKWFLVWWTSCRVETRRACERKEMLTLHTRTRTFVSSYDISSHPAMIPLITGFTVAVYKLAVYKTLSHSLSVNRCNTLSSFTRVWDGGRRGKIVVLTFKVRGVFSWGCVVYSISCLCMCGMTQHILEAAQSNHFTENGNRDWKDQSALIYCCCSSACSLCLHNKGFSNRRCNLNKSICVLIC